MSGDDLAQAAKALGTLVVMKLTRNIPVLQPGELLMTTSSNRKSVRVTDHLCGEITGDRWISRTKASDAELWCFLRSTP